MGDERVLRWRDGVFVTRFEAGGATSVASDAADEQTFLACLEEFDRTGRRVSPHPGKTYAPNLFAKATAAKGTASKRLAGAMERLFAKAAIHVDEEGSPSKRRDRTVRGPKPESQEPTK